MFRLVVVSAVLACVAASGIGHHYEAPLVATSYASHPVTHVEKHVIPGRTWTEVQPQVQVVEQPYIHKVGDQVHNVPTGVSYQSSSVVHSKNVVTPILAQGVQKHIVPAEPIYKTYQEPSLVKTVATQQHVAYSQHAAPLAYSHHAAPLAYAQHAAPLSYAHHSAPLAYAAAPVAYAAAPVAYSGAHYGASPVLKSTVWGNQGVIASPYSYGLGAKAAVASPWSYGYGVKSALASPWAHQAW